MKNACLAAAAALLFPLLLALPAGDARAEHRFVVNCDRGQSLARALKAARAGSKLKLRGVCRERVTITTDGLTLDGQGSAVIQGDGPGPIPSQFDPLVRIEGARRVTLKGLTVENGPAEGILAENGASIRLENVTALNNGSMGIAVFANSTAELDGVASHGNLFGLAGFDSAVAILHGTIALTSNLLHGLAFEGGSAVDLRAAQIDASYNQGFGLVFSGSELNVFDFGQGSNITVSNNGGCGLAIVSGGLMLVLSPPPFFGSGINVVTVKDNGICGVFMPTNGSIESPLGSAKFVIENNPVGLNLGDNSSGHVLGGLQVTNNGIGMLADGAGSITFGSFAGNVSSISGNITSDVDLRFGSRVTFCDMTVGTVLNDGTALTRMPSSCPTL